jgi:hypothetical protein
VRVRVAGRAVRLWTRTRRPKKASTVGPTRSAAPVPLAPSAAATTLAGVKAARCRSLA